MTALLTVTEAAVRLGMSRSWLEKEVAARRVAFTALGSRTLFTPAQVEKIISDHEKKPLGPMARRTVLAARS